MLTTRRWISFVIGGTLALRLKEFRTVEVTERYLGVLVKRLEQ